MPHEIWANRGTLWYWDEKTGNRHIKARTKYIRADLVDDLIAEGEK